MKVAIVILARKNSKRIPNKNFKLFNGKPLIHWTLDCASKLEYPIYFYSDCEKMRFYARNHFKEINVMVKPDKYGFDKHDTGNEIKEYNKKIGADIIVNLQVTSPIRDVKAVKFWIEDFKKSKFKCGISVYKLPSKFFYMGGQPLNYDIKERDYNGCKKGAIYFENGSFYIFKKEMLKGKHFIQEPMQMYLDANGVDIDNEWQWEQAELTHRKITGVKVCKQK